jgi:hypothetical protein
MGWKVKRTLLLMEVQHGQKYRQCHRLLCLVALPVFHQAPVSIAWQLELMEAAVIQNTLLLMEV